MKEIMSYIPVNSNGFLRWVFERFTRIDFSANASGISNNSRTKYKPMDSTLVTFKNDQNMDNNQATIFPLILFKMDPTNYHSSHLEAI